MQPTPPLPLLARLDAHDRALMTRLVIEGDRSRLGCRVWRGLTHLGGARFSAAITLALLAIVPGSTGVFFRGASTLVLSHLIVRVIKQLAVRARPTESMAFEALVAVPDELSFPSGHACAAMSVALTFSLCFPTVAPAIILLAFVVGASRIALGVHYPGDVLAGQLIAVLVELSLPI